MTDLNSDGNVSVDEVEVSLRKIKTQRRLAIAAFTVNALYVFLLAILIAVGVMTPEMVSAQTGIGGMFLTTNAGVIAAYFGVEGWLSKK